MVMAWVHLIYMYMNSAIFFQSSIQMYTGNGKEFHDFLKFSIPAISDVAVMKQDL